jgi:predicted ATP-dependent endonuclease of OLD family
LVLIEEPEAHLHAQVQQVFINKAYEILRNNTRLKNIKTYTTQLVISTHSNHIAHEAKFTSLRYFKRSNPLIEASQTTTVINLSKTFGEETETSKFATRYLKTTHCDLFFADAVILVEGPAEKILVPSFIKRHQKLHNCYISLLEIGGSHAHTLRPLIENIGIVTLVITDLDSIGAVGNNGKVQPEKGKALRTGNDTLKTWLPKLSDLDQLLELPDSDKQDDKGLVRVAYQTAIKFGEDSNSILTYPYTFEDSLVLTNKTSFSALTETKGLLKQMAVAAQITDPKQAAEKLFDAITAKGAKKAEFALELLYYKDPELVTVPKYISDGLAWLENKLVIVKTGLQILN